MNAEWTISLQLHHDYIYIEEELQVEVGMLAVITYFHYFLMYLYVVTMSIRNFVMNYCVRYTKLKSSDDFSLSHLSYFSIIR